MTKITKKKRAPRKRWAKPWVAWALVDRENGRMRYWNGARTLAIYFTRKEVREKRDASAESIVRVRITLEPVSKRKEKP